LGPRCGVEQRSLDGVRAAGDEEGPRFRMMHGRVALADDAGAGDRSGYFLGGRAERARHLKRPNGRTRRPWLIQRVKETIGGRGPRTGRRDGQKFVVVASILLLHGKREKKTAPFGQFQATESGARR